MYMKGFHWDSSTNYIETTVFNLYGEQLTPEMGYKGKQFRGNRSSYMILNFVDNDSAWKFIKYVSAHRQSVLAPVPFSEDKTPKPQKLWASMEKTPEEQSHSSDVSEAVRALHLLKEKGVISQQIQIESNYGSHKRGGNIVLKDAQGVEAKVVAIKSGQTTWDEVALNSMAVNKSDIDSILSQM